MFPRDLRFLQPARMPPVLLAVLAMVMLHSGAAFATTLFDDLGPAGVTWLRLTLATLILLAATGRSLLPAVRAARRRDLLATLALGVVSAGMMMFYAQASARLPLGTTTSLEFLGPLTVAVVGMRRRREFAWIGAAVAGVLCLTQPWTGAANLTGVLFALAAATCWGSYIIGTQHVGGRFKIQHALALSLTVASIIMAPFGAPAVVADHRPHVLLTGLGIALLMPLIPFLLEMSVLQRMSRTAYGTVAGMEPAVSLLAGVVIIAQVPDLLQIAGIALVVTAGIGAARGDRAGGGDQPVSVAGEVFAEDNAHGTSMVTTVGPPGGLSTDIDPSNAARRRSIPCSPPAREGAAPP